jgi:hypothetical protein
MRHQPHRQGNSRVDHDMSACCQSGKGATEVRHPPQEALTPHEAVVLDSGHTSRVH